MELVGGGGQSFGGDGHIEFRMFDEGIIFVHSDSELVVACAVRSDDGGEGEGFVLGEGGGGPEDEVLDRLVELGAGVGPTGDLVPPANVLEVVLVDLQDDVGGACHT